MTFVTNRKKFGKSRPQQGPKKSLTSNSRDLFTSLLSFLGGLTGGHIYWDIASLEILSMNNAIGTGAAALMRDYTLPCISLETATPMTNMSRAATRICFNSRI